MIFFVFFINDFVKEIKELRKGIMVGEINLGILLYVDDIVILFDLKENL